MKKNLIFLPAIVAIYLFTVSCKKSSSGTGGTGIDSSSMEDNYIVSTYAGSGSPAPFNNLTGVSMSQDGGVLVADFGHSVIQKISITGSTMVFAGNGGGQDCTDGQGLGAGFTDPEGIFTDQGGTVIVADTHCGIRMIDASGSVKTFFKNDLNNPYLVYPAFACIDSHGNVFLISGDEGADPSIYMINAEGAISRYAGSETKGYNDGSVGAASFFFLKGICVDQDDNLYVADGNRIRKITGGSVTTLAGSKSAGYADGNASGALFLSVDGICVDGNNNVFVTDGGRIREISASGNVTTLAGSDNSGYVDGKGSSALFSSPRGICVDGIGNLYIADEGNNLVRKIAAK